MGIFRRGRLSRQDPPNRLGIYRFRNKLTGEVDYIGEAVNIARRIVVHLRSSKPVSLDTHYVEWKPADGISTSRTGQEHERDKIRINRAQIQACTVCDLMSNRKEVNYGTFYQNWDCGLWHSNWPPPNRSIRHSPARWYLNWGGYISNTVG